MIIFKEGRCSLGFSFARHLIYLFILFFCCAVFADEKMYPSVNRSFPNASISDLSRSHKSGSYNVKGFVVFIYKCPECPSGMLCKACMPDNIVISEKNNALTGYYLNSTELIIYTRNSNNFREFKVGSFGEFSIALGEHPDGQSQSGKLIGYNTIDTSDD